MSLEWPVIILAAGLLFFALMGIGGKGTAWMATPGSMITAIGLILLAQAQASVDDNMSYTTWRWAWSLVFPTAFGLGLVLQGLRSGNSTLRGNGVGVLFVGLVTTGIGWLAFTLLAGIGPTDLDQIGRMLCIGGLFAVLVWAFFGRPKPASKP